MIPLRRLKPSLFTAPLPGPADPGKFRPSIIFRRTLHFLAKITGSSNFRLSVIIAGFVLLMGLRLFLESFAISLGYAYLLFISLAGYWFGVRGGVTAAFAAIMVFIIELQLHPDWPGRGFVVNGMMLRFFIYLLEGFLLGYFHDLDQQLKEEQRNKAYFETLAYYDELTGCVNFRWVMQLLEKEIALAVRYHTELTLVMLDIDHFKKVNDERGHLAGNDALRLFSGILRNSIRAVDVAGRYGGDEFMLLLHDASAEQATVLLQRVRELLAKNPLRPDAPGGREGPALTFSAGVVACPRNGTAVNDLLEAGDHALYQAKKEGRDRIFVEKRCWLRCVPKTGLKAVLVDPATGNTRESSGIGNISQRGVLLLFPDRDLPQGDVLCRFSLGERAPSELKCRIVHEGNAAAGDYSVGIYFVERPFIDVRSVADLPRMLDNE